MSHQAYPLQWPEGRQRKSPHFRKDALFGTTLRSGYKQKLTVAEAISRVQSELDVIGGRYPVISSNLEIRLDGFPRSGQPEPNDPGVCLYFELQGKPTAMPCDTYTRVADNIAAIAAHIEATRKIERHGVASVSEMFAGFQSLPAPGRADSQQWWKVLHVSAEATSDEIRTAYRQRAAILHPDKPGGSAAAMAELNAARDEALRIKQ